MKKIFMMVLSVLMVFMLCATVCGEMVSTVNVYVSISDKGTSVINFEKIEVSDVDNDSAVTINDVLITAHQKFFDGESGYGFAETEYGVSITKLWGDTSGSYGYYKNNASAWSLADNVSEGDYVYAFVYSDTETWSDTYSYFNANETLVSLGEEFGLELYMAGYDENWNPITELVSGATILIDGQKTEIKTDENGKANIKIDSVGTHTISAMSDALTLVPPICLVEVSVVEDSKSETESTENEKPSTPNTGDVSDCSVWYIACVLAAFVMFGISKRVHEK